MTNLSELLPSGGGAKEFSVVASGTLASGQTVGLKADGTVEAISETAEGLGAQTNFTVTADNFTCVYDSTADRFVLIYRTNSDFYFYGVVAERSGSTITFGTAQVVNTVNQNNNGRAVYDPTANRVLVFQDQDPGYGGGVTVTPATVTANTNSISFATGQNFLAGLSCSPKAVCYDPVNLKTFLLWRNGSASNYGYGSVFNAANPSTISIDSNSGTDITGNNSMDTIEGGDCAFDTQRSRIAIVYQSPSTAWLRTTSVTISSGSPSATGTHQIDSNYYWSACHIAFDSSINRFLIIGRSTTNVGYGWVAEMDASGNMNATSALTTFPNSGTNAQGKNASVISNNAGKWLVVSRNTNTGATGSYYVVTDYLLAPVFSNATNVLTSGDVGNSSIASDGSRFLFMMSDSSSSTSLTRVFNFLTNNVSSFIGITSEAIANSATGKVNPQGGVATSSTVSSATTFGGAEVFANNGAADTIRSTYDSNSNRIVVAYTDNGNSGKGTASVGTVSGDTISWGPQALFLDAYAAHNSITFDSSNNKVVIAYVDAANQGYAVVGTVDPSNNTITFGSPTQFESGNTQMTSTVFDSSNNKVVIAYQDDADNDKGKAVVGVVSGTAITFPGAIGEWSSNTSSLGATFDSTNNKVVIFFRNGSISNHGYAVVGAVSGNNITFGSETQFWPADCLVERQGPTFDSTNNKVVLGYRDLGGTGYGYAVAGTVSGNTITFGTPQAFNSVTSIEVNSLFDPSANKIVFSYHNNYASGEIDTGSLSGTVFTFDTGAQFSSSGAYYNPLAYDSTAQKVVVAYRDAGNSNHGTAKVINLLGATETFTIGSTYYVQNDGTLTTTSSTVTAGKAISTTQLILNGAS